MPLHTINNTEGNAVNEVLELTNGLGVDLVVEAIGVPVGWYICQDIVKAGTLGLLRFCWILGGYLVLLI